MTGDGTAFRKLENKLAHKPGIKDPAALAASIGREKYGAAEFNAMAAAGRAKRQVSRKQARGKSSSKSA